MKSWRGEILVVSAELSDVDDSEDKSLTVGRVEPKSSKKVDLAIYLGRPARPEAVSTGASLLTPASRFRRGSLQ